MASIDDGFEALRDYDGCEFVFDCGYVARFRFRRTEDRVTDAWPHPYRYSLTLHDARNKRVLGFDNAHAVAASGPVRKRRHRAADHWHAGPGDAGQAYRFESPQALLGDFMKAVEEFLVRKGLATHVVDVRTTR